MTKRVSVQERVCESVCVRECVCVCERQSVRVCVCVCVRVCVRETECARKSESERLSMREIESV